jgi:hypothetical protein
MEKLKEKYVYGKERKKNKKSKNIYMYARMKESDWKENKKKRKLEEWK